MSYSTVHHVCISSIHCIHYCQVVFLHFISLFRLLKCRYLKKNNLKVKILSFSIKPCDNALNKNEKKKIRTLKKIFQSEFWDQNCTSTYFIMKTLITL